MASTASPVSSAPSIDPAVAPRGDRSEVEARIPEFGDLSGESAAPSAGGSSLDNLLDVACTVTAELGRIKLPIAEVLKFNVGSVVELDRLVSQPVDILVQGVLIARGEVVVVNDRFAIRIQEIVDVKKRNALAAHAKPQ